MISRGRSGSTTGQANCGLLLNYGAVKYFNDENRPIRQSVEDASIKVTTSLAFLNSGSSQARWLLSCFSLQTGSPVGL